MHLLKEGIQQRSIAQVVDAARHTLSEREDLLEGIVSKRRIRMPTDEPEPMLDVRARLRRFEGIQVVGRDDPLTKLFETFGHQGGAEFFLAEQEHLHERSALILEVRQHSQFLDGLRWQVLSLVDDQKRALVFANTLQEELLEVP